MPIVSDRQQAILTCLAHPFWDIPTIGDSAWVLYDQALTHDTYANEQRDRGIACKHYQRLEFLGDRILNHAIAEFLFRSFATDAQGTLTDKVKFTNNENLAHLAKAKGLGLHPPVIRLGRGQNLEDSIIADIFEALIAAIYLDPDYGMAKIHEIVYQQLAEDIRAFKPEQDNYKNRLQIYVQKHLRIGQIKDELVYRVVSDQLDLHNRHRFTVEVKIVGQPWGQGQGGNKAEAEQNAAKAALSKIKAGDSPLGRP